MKKYALSHGSYEQLIEKPRPIQKCIFENDGPIFPGGCIDVALI